MAVFSICTRDETPANTANCLLPLPTKLKAMKTFFIFFIFIAIELSGQSADEQLLRASIDEMNATGLHEGLPYSTLNNSKKPSVEGSQFLSEDWEEGVLLITEGMSFRIKGRYDIYNDEFLIQTEKGAKLLLPEKTKAITLKNRLFAPYGYLKKNKKFGYSFFELLSEGEITLLLKREIYLKKSNPHPVLGHTLNKNVEIQTKAVFFTIKKGDIAKRMKKSKKEVLSILRKRRSAVNKFINEHKLKVRKEADLIAIFDFYNKKASLRQ